MSLFRRRVLVFFLEALTASVDALSPVWSRLLPRRAMPRIDMLNPGISVIIPERSNPVLLSECIESVLQASRNVDEPVELIIVVNGSPQADYEELLSRFPSVRWIFSAKPLWFAGAVRAGLAVARHDWVYLLNSDMTLEPLALSELLPWRATHVFGIASQIFFKDSTRRREETGWTTFRESDGLLYLSDATPEAGMTRGTFYAGGGASLFQKALLVGIAAASDAYAPFYWEDVEWGTMAWRCGLESLFCPKSKVFHHHRATNRLLFAEGEIDRIFHRNMVRYELRNRVLYPGSRERFFEHLQVLNEDSFWEVLSPGSVIGILRARLKCWTLPFHELPLQHTWLKYYPKSQSTADAKPAVIVVTPFAIYPPSHGGAVRLHHLIAAVSRKFDVVLLSDEATGYSESSLKYFKPLSSIHLVAGRSDDEENGWVQRIRNHSHDGLREWLRMITACRSTALVQVEFLELAGLVDAKIGSIPWLLTLHEVWVPNPTDDLTQERDYILSLIHKFDAVLTCSEEDAQLLDHPNVHVVPNGADIHAFPYSPSPESGPILFVGPFRYRPNLDGIRGFLETVYPLLLKSVPEARLWVLGGVGAAATASSMSCFNQAGVTVMDYIEEPRSLLNQCAVTINPLFGVRGSCLKVAESIAAGRVCVSTKEGARGFLDSDLPALVVVESIAEFTQRLQQLLSDPGYRNSLEQPSLHALSACSWENGASKLCSIYSRMIPGS